eukprot:2234034-Rhodomonas_salina.2
MRVKLLAPLVMHRAAPSGGKTAAGRATRRSIKGKKDGEDDDSAGENARGEGGDSVARTACAWNASARLRIGARLRGWAATRTSAPRKLREGCALSCP